MPPTPIPVPLSVINHRQRRFELLVRHVQGCHACPRMEGRRRVLSNLNGHPSPKSKVMFIAEAPGRFGADRTGIPIHGDPTGHNFEKLLASVGWTRADVFVTNCVLCNPRDPETGNNDSPTMAELENCSFNLESQLVLVDPKIIVTLGGKALEALSIIRPHSLTLRDFVATPSPWLSFILFPLYHQSPRALIHRGMNQQLHDFKLLKELASSL